MDMTYPIHNSLKELIALTFSPKTGQTAALGGQTAHIGTHRSDRQPTAGQTAQAGLTASNTPVRPPEA